ncbi:glycoside hydrolase family protein [Erythrobacter sp. HA6-11]
MWRVLEILFGRKGDGGEAIQRVELNRRGPSTETAVKGAGVVGLAAIVGFTAAELLLTHVPADESGRKVEVEIAEDGRASVRHISGRQYLRAYLDIAGVATICDGLTSINGRKVRRTDHMTEAQCAYFLEKELIVHAKGFMQCTPSLQPGDRPHLIYAGVGLTYNIGVAAYCGSTARKRFVARNWAGGCLAMTWWNKARVKGVLRPVKGLTDRRQREYRECMKDV